jgi:hypothetical protein
MSKNDKNVLIWGIIILVVVVIIVMWSNSGTNKIINGPEETQSVYQTVSPTPSGKVSHGSVTTPVANQTYTQVTKEYKGKTIQFNELCMPNPSGMTIKKGTRILFDNRSKVTQTITVGGLKFTLPAWGWQIQTITGTSLPVNLSVACKASTGAQGAGGILLQANISNF